MSADQVAAVVAVATAVVLGLLVGTASRLTR